MGIIPWGEEFPGGRSSPYKMPKHFLAIALALISDKNFIGPK